jgi:hypothetical protein
MQPQQSVSSSPCVAAYPCRRSATQHETASQTALAQRVAAMLGLPLADNHRPTRNRYAPNLFYVPDRTLVGLQRARTLGVTGPQDLFGGVVPHSFVATKSITHGLPAAESAAPPGWNRDLGARLQELTLPGYTVFNARDAWLAGRLLLRNGPLRLKPSAGVAGRGQVVVHDESELEAALRAQPAREMAALGLVLEEDLADVVTYSVGWLVLAGVELSYVGTQTLTRDNQGHCVYGGSRLRCARGGRDALQALDLTEDERCAICLASRYDEEVSAAYPSLLASRRNYDVAMGHNAAGEPRAGVLEQSWRAGGASIAELAALQALVASPRLASVCAETRERYGEAEPEPVPERCIYRGVDSKVGFITKSGGIVEDDHASN